MLHQWNDKGILLAFCRFSMGIVVDGTRCSSLPKHGLFVCSCSEGCSDGTTGIQSTLPVWMMRNLHTKCERSLKLFWKNSVFWLASYIFVSLNTKLLKYFSALFPGVHGYVKDIYGQIASWSVCVCIYIYLAINNQKVLGWQMKPNSNMAKQWGKVKKKNPNLSRFFTTQ